MEMIYNPKGEDYIKEGNNLVYVQGQPNQMNAYNLTKLTLVRKISDNKWFDKSIRPMLITNEVEIEYI